MKLGLIDGRHNFASQICKQLLEMADLEVRHVDVSDFGSVEELLHFLPGPHIISAQQASHAVVWFGEARKVDEIQVDVVETEVFQQLLEILPNTIVPVIVEFGGYPDLVSIFKAPDSARDCKLGTTDFRRRLESSVNMSIACSQCMANCLSDLIRSGFPGPGAYRRNLVACVQGKL
jgi:hypothetical protein